VKQQVFSFGDFQIRDHAGKNIFNVQGSWPRHFYLKDLSGNTLIDIKQRSLIALQPSYDLYDAANGALILTVTHVFSIGGSKFTVQGGTEPLVIHGDYFSWTYTISRVRDGAIMASVQRNLWAWSDSFTIEVSLQENIALMLSCVVVIDHEIQKKRNRK